MLFRNKNLNYGVLDMSSEQKTVQTLFYRDRSIVTRFTQQKSSGYDEDTRGFSHVVNKDNQPITPSVPCSYYTYMGSDYEFNEYYAGWILVGDFVFLQTSVIRGHQKYHRNLYLCPTSDAVDLKECSLEEFTSQCICLHRVPSETNTRGQYFLHYTKDGIDTHDDLYEIIKKRCSGEFTLKVEDIEDVEGAARVYVDELGWRWLFPHPDGISASWDRLKSTTSVDDFKHMLSTGMLERASDKKKELIKNHFDVCVYADLKTSAYKFSRGLNLSSVSSTTPLFPELSDLLESTFTSDPLLDLELVIERLRLPEDNDSRYSIKFGIIHDGQVPLEEVLAGADPGPIGWKVTVKNKSAPSLSGLERLSNIHFLDASGTTRLTSIQDNLLNTDGSLKCLKISSSENLTNLPVKDLQAIEHLNIDYCSSIKDLSFISSLTQLKTLSIASTSIMDLTPLSTLTKLRNLNISSLKVKSLKPLEHLNNLKSLEKWGLSEITSLDGLPLNWLEKQTNLTFRSKHLTDLSALKKAIRLVKLEIDSEQMESEGLIPINELTSLRNLELCCPKVLDLNFISTDNLIEDLYIRNYREGMNNIESLKFFPHLKKLRTSLSDSADLSVFEHLPNLEEVDIDKKVINSLDWFKACTNLQVLDLDDVSGLSDLSVIEGMKHLRKLSFSKIDLIKDLSPLSQLTNLKHIYLNNETFGKIPVEIADLTPLSNLKNLTYLCLPSTSTITSLLPIQNLTKLTQLQFGTQSSLETLEGYPIELLQEESYLSLRLPNLKNADVLKHATKANSISLYGSALTQIPPIGHLTKLSKFSISDSPLLTDLSHLAPGENIVEIKLSNTPNITSLKPLLELPKLYTLNTYTYTKEERIPEHLPGSEELSKKLGDEWSK